MYSVFKLDFVFFFLFFFSSRRRHTRLQGDWSSDVCSSDLPSIAWACLFRVHVALSAPRPVVGLFEAPVVVGILGFLRDGVRLRRGRLKLRVTDRKSVV